MGCTVLVVCLGNVCRSPVAERLLRLRFDDLLGRRADAVTVTSAGVRALVGHPMDDRSAAELTRLGGDARGFASTQLTTPMLESAGLVLTATIELRSRVLEEAPRALRRTFTLRELAELIADGDAGEGPAELVADAARRRKAPDVDAYDVPDPIGRSVHVHRQVADLIDRSCTVIARSLAATVPPGLHPPGS